MLEEMSISPLSHPHFMNFSSIFDAEAHLLFEYKQGNGKAQSTEIRKYISIYSGYVMFRLLWGISRASLSVLKNLHWLTLKF